MPYLPVDIDAKRRAALIEAALGLPKHTAVGGLLDVWEHVWREKRDVVPPLYLRACLGSDDRLIDAFVDAGFLEPVEGGHRVRGAAKWLFGMEGRSRGGKAAKGNLIPGAVHKKEPKNQPKEKEGDTYISSAPAEGQPKASRSPPSAPSSALTPSIQHPASKNLFAGENPPAARKAKSEKPPDPRHAPLVKALVEAAPGYTFTGRDAKAVAELLALAEPPEIVTRWKRARASAGFPRVREIHELPPHWNHFGADPADPNKPVRDPAKYHPDGSPKCRLL